MRLCLCNAALPEPRRPLRAAPSAAPPLAAFGPSHIVGCQGVSVFASTCNAWFFLRTCPVHGELWKARHLGFGGSKARPRYKLSFSYYISETYAHLFELLAC